MHRPGRRSVREALTHGVALGLSSLIAYALVTTVLAHLHSVSRADDMIGGVWAVIATLFVYRYPYDQSLSAALSRVVATLVSFVLCLAYLLFLPFSPWGMAVLIGLGTLVTTLIGRPEDTITAAITTAVVMVSAGVSPDHAWQQPILRLADTVVGAAAGLAFAWIAMHISRWDKALLGSVQEGYISRSSRHNWVTGE
jgi:uncharacterized membrane protein YccC